MSRSVGAVDGRSAAAATTTELTTGWELAHTAAGTTLEELEALDGLAWHPAQVPGTAAGALRAAGLWRYGDGRDFDFQDWWFRLRFEARSPVDGEQLLLVLEGIATVAKVFLNGELLLESESMFESHTVEVTGRVNSSNELVIHCLALAPLLGVARRPRARWRTRLVSERNLRFYRTMLLGRAPGFAPGPAAVGPWKPVWLERGGAPIVRELRLRPGYERGEATLSVDACLLDERRFTAASIELIGPTGVHRAGLGVEARGAEQLVNGALTIAGPAAWWPHTHGSPALYTAELLISADSGEFRVPAGRIGFRSVETVGELETDGLDLRLNGIVVFARGAVWTPADLASPYSTREQLRPLLVSAVRAGMNMLRVPGTACYESAAFYDLCDELGILVWQDFMFANLDYPDHDPVFRASVDREVRQLLRLVGARPSLAVLCGGSEVAQQAAMMGLNPQLAGGSLYEELLPELIAEAQVRVPYLPSTPWGGDLPFRPSRGVAHYYGVGAYLRPLEDARRSEVRFAAECLAFSNVPDDTALPPVPVHHPLWKGGVPRDVGAGWDFEDVRDHYLRLLFEVDPVALRTSDHERYLELSRQLTGEVMGEVLGEWRRGASPCAGALVLWLKDVVAGAGWGLLDHLGQPKVAYHHVRRALAPVAVWSTDEGLDGVVAHLANDRSAPLEATLRLALYRDLEVRVDEVERELVLEPHSIRAENIETLLGRFVDAAWSYRFGPPSQDLIALSLEDRSGSARRLLSQCFRLPAGRPRGQETAERLGVTASIRTVEDCAARLVVSADRFLYGVRVLISGFTPSDDAFSVEPGRAREVLLERDGLEETDQVHADPTGHLTALNLSGRVTVTVS